MNKNKVCFLLIEFAALITNIVFAYTSYCLEEPWYFIAFTSLLAVLWLISIVGGFLGKDVFRLEECFNDEMQRWKDLENLEKILKEEQNAHVR